jgi:hypothetical protein
LASEPGKPPAIDLAAVVADCLPPRRTQSLAYRPRSALPMNLLALPMDTVLLLDSTVYIDSGKTAGLPPMIGALLNSIEYRHANPCVAELAYGYGRLDPKHPKTDANRAIIARILQAIPQSDIVDASPAAWAKAGALAGWLSRTQGLADDRRRALFNDALLFTTAQELGLTLLSGNIRDMDLLLQIGGPADVLLYALD